MSAPAAAPLDGASLERLFESPNELARDYQHFDVAGRLLLTGHSHQAWPDCAFSGLLHAFVDAARLVDEKWEAAFAAADRVRAGFARLLDVEPDSIALGPSVHDLLVRFLSALPLKARPRIVTSDGEFHSVRRQLDRLGEEGVAIHRLPCTPAEDLAERLAGAIDDGTAAVVVSAVLFEDARIVPGLARLQEACARRGAACLVDAYHALNVLPFSLAAQGLADAYVVGGGYKYCQLGEGNCFLRLPPDCGLRPVVTGWFSEFDALEAAPAEGRIAYGAGPARFAGSTYDPSSHYRGAEVFDFFAARGLSPPLLRQVSQHQLALLARGFDALDLPASLITRDRATPLSARGGFLALRSPRASDFQRALGQRGVLCDARGEHLRLGPAPYLSDAQLRDAVAALGEAAAAL